MWEIYSIGDAAFLERVLTALALLAGTGNLEQVAAIGMVVGVIILGFQAMIQGGAGIRFQNLLIAWILYMGIFGGSAQVVIEDVYTGQVRVVDNVPQGIAAVGSMVSQVGFGMTELFEQAFGTAKMTEQGFAFAIETLADLRKTTLNKAGLGSANSPAPGDDIWQSWTNYIADCTMVGVEQGQYTIEDIRTNNRSASGDILSQLQFNSQAYGTQFKIAAAPGNGFMTCTDAFNFLQSYTSVQFQPALERKLSESFDIPPADVDLQIQNAFQALEQGIIDGENYMLATAMAPIFEWSLVNNEMNFQRVASASMIHSAIQQRNDQWAVEQALFNAVVRPMMTFFEGFVYALAPFVAFLVGLGPAGISLVAKYLLIMVWIQLWMPVLAIINLYLHMAVSRKMIALQSPSQGDTPLDSFYGVYSLDQTLQNWISTGGMLAASVPALTLMLIYGSAVTATSLAGRMSSGSSNVTPSSPDLSQNSPIMQRGSMVNSSASAGLRTTDAETMKLQGTGAYTQMQSSAQDEMRTSQEQFSQQFAQQVQGTYQTQEQASQAISAKVSQMSQDSEVFKASESYGRSLVQGTGAAESIDSNTAARIGLNAQAGIGISALGAGMKADGSSSTIYGVKTGASFSEEDRQQIQQNQGTSNEASASLVNSLARDSTDTSQDSFTRSLLASNSEALSESASDVLSASERYSEMNQAQQGLSQNTSLTNETLPGVARRSGVDEEIQQYAERYQSSGGFGALVQQKYDALEAMNPNQRHEDRQLAAKALAIGDGSYLNGISDPAVRSEAASQGAGILNRLLGQSVPNQTGSMENEGVSGLNTSDQNTKNRVESENLSGPGVSAEEVQANVNAGANQTNQNIQSAKVDDHYDNARGNVSEAAQSQAANYNRNAIDQATDRAGSAANANEEARRTQGWVDLAPIPAVGDFTDIAGYTKGEGFVGDLASSIPGYAPEQSRDAFLNMSTDERGQAVNDVFSGVQDQLVRQGMDERAAGLVSAQLVAPVMDSIYSEGSNTDFGVFNQESANLNAQELREFTGAVQDSSFPILKEQIAETRADFESSGGKVAANTAMQDIGSSVALMAGSASLDTASSGIQMVNGMVSAITPSQEIPTVFGDSLPGRVPTEPPAQGFSNEDGNRSGNVEVEFITPGHPDYVPLPDSPESNDTSADGSSLSSAEPTVINQGLTSQVSPDNYTNNGNGDQADYPTRFGTSAAIASAANVNAGDTGESAPTNPAATPGEPAMQYGNSPDMVAQNESSLTGQESFSDFNDPQSGISPDANALASATLDSVNDPLSVGSDPLAGQDLQMLAQTDQNTEAMGMSSGFPPQDLNQDSATFAQNEQTLDQGPVSSEVPTFGGLPGSQPESFAQYGGTPFPEEINQRDEGGLGSAFDFAYNNNSGRSSGGFDGQEYLDPAAGTTQSDNDSSSGPPNPMIS